MNRAGFLSTAQLASVLERVSYRPGWTIRVYDGRREGQHIAITTQVPDAYDPAETVTLDVHSMLPPQRDTEAFLTWLSWRLGRLEIHESREWFRYNGRAWDDPHADGADRDL